MTERFPIIRLILLLLLLPLLGNSQQLDHVQGEILIQINEDTDLKTLLSSVEKESGKPLDINKINPVSKAFKVWKYNFDHTQINEIDLLHSFRKNPFIVNAQFNYFTSNRLVPNDPVYSDLWHLNNIGQNNGTADMDLDAELAWDISTGGNTYLGDTVVICIVDERFDLNHEDLHANIWVNHEEIPDNGIDDDMNGYVDDYRGWNVSFDNDNVGNLGVSDSHGTSVAGVAGAVGNNETGVTGVSWQVKMMLVSRGSTTADAIEAYTYPFIQRKRFNLTQGQEGAYVVSTNSSWGVDFGTPEDAPLWCAMYDSLGSVGILSAAATINSNFDVCLC